jgi:hypothetical protein
MALRHARRRAGVNRWGWRGCLCARGASGTHEEDCGEKGLGTHGGLLLLGGVKRHSISSGVPLLTPPGRARPSLASHAIRTLHRRGSGEDAASG